MIARVTPEHKVRLVDTLKAKGQIVAMTGDGVNGAPAERRTVFSLGTCSDRTFNIATIGSVPTLILATVLGPLERLLETTSLDVQQWLICICAGLAIVVVSEIRKAIRRAGAPAAAGPESPPEG